MEETDWSVPFNVTIDWEKNETLIHFKNGNKINSYMTFRDKQVNIPFSPWVLHKYNKKLWSPEEIAEDIYKKYKKRYYNP